MSIRIVRGEIGSKDVTARTVLPNASRDSLAPFERVAETIATPRRRFLPHKHEGVEVLTYVTEGSATYVYGSGTPDPLIPGSTRLLTATAAVSHSINPGQGTTVRWFAVVASLPTAIGGQSRLQSGLAQPSGVQPDGTILRKVVGPGTGVLSSAGLECRAIEFAAEGTSFYRVGHDRVAVCYCLAGEGMVDNQTLEAGEAALLAEVAGVALQGNPGFHVIFVTAPTGAKSPA